MTPREFPDISFRVFIGRILPDQLVISLNIKLVLNAHNFFCCFFALDEVHCLPHSKNLSRIDSTRLITRIICANYARNEIPRRDQR